MDDANLWDPRVSPDGKSLSYVHRDLGESQIIVQAFPKPGARSLVSNGNAPRWSKNGHELFYRISDKLMSVEIQTAPVLKAGKPRELVVLPERVSRPGLNVMFDVAPR